jgi:hypothetical protein
MDSGPEHSLVAQEGDIRNTNLGDAMFMFGSRRRMALCGIGALSWILSSRRLIDTRRANDFLRLSVGLLFDEFMKSKPLLRGLEIRGR